MADARSDASTSATDAEDAHAEQWLGDNIDPDDDEQESAAEDGDADEQDAGLGDAGKQALDRMKAKWQAERQQRRDLQAKLDEAATGGDDTDPEQIRAEAERTATSKANQRILRSEIRAAAAGKLADPADALKFLDLDQFEVTEQGELDSDEISDALETLLTEKPYLAAATVRRFQGSGDGGARNGHTPKQITSREELAKLSHSERLQAYHDGRLTKLLES